MAPENVKPQSLALLINGNAPWISPWNRIERRASFSFFLSLLLSSRPTLDTESWSFAFLREHILKNGIVMLLIQDVSNYCFMAHLRGCWLLSTLSSVLFSERQSCLRVLSPCHLFLVMCSFRRLQFGAWGYITRLVITRSYFELTTRRLYLSTYQRFLANQTMKRQPS